MYKLILGLNTEFSVLALPKLHTFTCLRGPGGGGGGGGGGGLHQNSLEIDLIVVSGRRE